LQAIATARRLGAVVSGYDTRAVVKEQVQSLGATFVESISASTRGRGRLRARAQQRSRPTSSSAWSAATFIRSDIVITTAAVPGKRAPLLITEDAVRGMKPGSVIVDLAAETGGNCALTEPGQTVVKHGVTIVGTTNLPSTMPYAREPTLLAQRLYAARHLAKDGTLAARLTTIRSRAGRPSSATDEIVHEPTQRGARGERTHERASPRRADRLRPRRLRRPRSDLEGSRRRCTRR
jgi:NAD(P) transhydrogenase subunit alpha